MWIHGGDRGLYMPMYARTRAYVYVCVCTNDTDVRLCNCAES